MKPSFARTSMIAIVIAIAGGALGLGTNALRAGGLALGGAVSAGAAGGAAACSAAGEATQVPETTLDDARALYGLPSVTFVDARPASAYWTGHIRGAINLPYEVAVEAAGKSSLPVPRDHRLIVYCDYVNCQLSSELTQLLSQSGCERVRVLKGGFPAWNEARLPVSTGAAP